MQELNCQSFLGVARGKKEASVCGTWIVKIWCQCRGWGWIFSLLAFRVGFELPGERGEGWRNRSYKRLSKTLNRSSTALGPMRTLAQICWEEHPQPYIFPLPFHPKIPKAIAVKLLSMPGCVPTRGSRNRINEDIPRWRGQRGGAQSDHKKMQDNTQDSEIYRGDSETEKGVREGLNFCLSRCSSVFLTVWHKCQYGFIPAHNIA